MRPPTRVRDLLLGVAASAALATGCGGDSSGDIDAAVDDAGTCQCPAAEPPLAGRIVSVTQTVTIAAGGVAAAGGVCPIGATLLGGGCRLALPADIRLLEAGRSQPAPDQPGYMCVWASSSATDNMVTGEAICLVPQ